MKEMKRNIMTVCGLALAIGSSAQQITFTGVEVARPEKDSILVQFGVVATGVPVNEEMTVTPVIKRDNHVRVLPPMKVLGRNKWFADLREQERKKPIRIFGKEFRLSRRPDWWLPDSVVRGRGDQCIPYRMKIAREPWMNDLTMTADVHIEDCCVDHRLPTREIGRGLLPRYVYQPKYESRLRDEAYTPTERLGRQLHYLAPLYDYAKVINRFDTERDKGSLVVHFRQGESKIDPAYNGNGAALKQLGWVLQQIRKDKDALLAKVVLVGMSSPEGKQSFNEQLALERANALLSELKGEVPSDIFEIISYGVDWSGLRKQVASSDMRDRALVLAVIDNVPEDRREASLRQLEGGRPYAYMMKHFFPTLRNAGYIQMFYQAQRPETQLSLTNEAVEWVNAKLYTDALKTLDLVKPTAETENLRGVCYLMTERDNEAEDAFRKAIEMGSQEAKENLKELIDHR